MELLREIKVARACEIPTNRRTRGETGGKAASFQRIKRGYYLTGLPDEEPSEYWDAAKIAAIARVRAHQMARPSAVFTLESACAVYGFATKAVNPPVTTVTDRKHHRKNVTFPAVTIGGYSVDTVRLESLSSRKTPKESRQIENINLVEPVELICTFLRYRRPLDAMIAVDSICATVCQADVRARKQTEQRFANLKARVLSRLDELRGCNGRTKALQLVDLMTPWSHSPLETRFRLLCSAYGFSTPVLQQRIDTGRGMFFLDAYFPQQRLGVELDGLAKYKSASVLQEEKLRDIAIERDGLRILHYVFRQLRRPQLVARELSERLAPSRPLLVVWPELLEGW